MAHICENCRDVFHEAYFTTLDNFTDDELARIDEVAVGLKNVIEAAKERRRNSISAGSSN
jgi:hypothetical protein